VPTYRRCVESIKAAFKEFDAFPQAVQEQMRFALEMVAAGAFPDVAKPLKGFEGDVFELAVAYRSDAYRAIYAVKIGDDIWVLHAFQKKSTRGIKTPQRHFDVARERLKRLKEMTR
jgi:phage-related protein